MTVPVLWLCGPPGVGKSTVGFAVFTRLAGSGVRAAFADADQLGLCYPAPPDDPGNHRTKARNLGAVWAAHLAAGARCLIFSGGAESAAEVASYTARVPGAAVTVCRLRADPAVLRDRYVRRGSPASFPAVAEILRGAAALDRAGFADVCVDTGGLGVGAAAGLVLERTGFAPGEPRPGEPPPVPPVDAAGVPVLWVSGPAGVGKSTVAFDVFLRGVRAGVTSAYVDLAQVSFVRPGAPAGHELAVRAVAAMWPAFRDAGARRLVLSGDVRDAATVARYAAALAGARLTVCRLVADRAALADRLLRRGRGDGPLVPGDELRGRPADELRRLAAPEETGPGVVVRTGGRSAAEVAAELRAAAAR